MHQNEIDEAVAQTRSRAEQKIRQLDEQIHAANARNAELKANEERIQREYLSTREALDRARTQHEEERKSMEATMRAMEDRMKQVESERIDDSAKRREIQEQNKSLRITVDNLRAQVVKSSMSLQLPQILTILYLQVETNRVQLTDRDLGRDREMVQVKTTLKDAQAQLSDVNKALQRKSKELEDLRIEMSEQIVAIEKRRDEDVGMYRRRAEEADLKMHELETSCLSEARRSKYIIDQTKEKYSNAVQQFELKLEEEKTNNRRWTNQNRELLESLRLMTEEKISIEKVSAALKSKCSSMREELAEAQRTISDLTVQLTQSFEAREEAVKASVRELAAINSTNKLKTKVVSFLPSNDDERMSFAAADAVSALSFGNLGVETDENDVDVFQAEIEKRNFEDMLQEAHRTVRNVIFSAGDST
jgi:myosin heavy subunit